MAFCRHSWPFGPGSQNDVVWHLAVMHGNGNAPQFGLRGDPKSHFHWILPVESHESPDFFRCKSGKSWLQMLRCKRWCETAALELAGIDLASPCESFSMHLWGVLRHFEERSIDFQSQPLSSWPPLWLENTKSWRKHNMYIQQQGACPVLNSKQLIRICLMPTLFPETVPLPKAQHFVLCIFLTFVFQVSFPTSPRPNRPLHRPIRAPSSSLRSPWGCQPLRRNDVHAHIALVGRWLFHVQHLWL